MNDFLLGNLRKELIDIYAINIYPDTQYYKNLIVLDEEPYLHFALCHIPLKEYIPNSGRNVIFLSVPRWVYCNNIIAGKYKYKDILAIQGKSGDSIRNIYPEIYTSIITDIVKLDIEDYE